MSPLNAATHVNLGETAIHVVVGGEDRCLYEVDTLVDTITC